MIFYYEVDAVLDNHLTGADLDNVLEYYDDGGFSQNVATDKRAKFRKWLAEHRKETKEKVGK